MKMGEKETIAFLCEKWKKEFAPKKQEWDKEPGWPAKLVRTEFFLNGRKYVIEPTDIGLTDDCWDQGFMESVQSVIKKNLEEYGAKDIWNQGFLD